MKFWMAVKHLPANLEHCQVENQLSGPDLKKIPWKLVFILGSIFLFNGVFAQDEVNQKKESDIAKSDEARLEDTLIPLSEEIPERTGPIIEWGDKLLGQGPIKPGIPLPGGTVWQPSLWAFGVMRSALQTVKTPDGNNSQWVNRLNLFANLKLSGTERIVAGVRPLDENGVFSGRQLEKGNQSSGEWLDGSNLSLRTLYFEGDLSEMFPDAGKNGNQPRHLGIVLGRQPLGVQQGILINDNIDAIGLSRTNIGLKGTSNFRISGLFGWNEIHRNDHVMDPDAWMIAMFSEADTYRRTLNFDMVYIHSDSLMGSGLYLAASHFHPVNRYNSTVRVAYSKAMDEETSAVTDGLVVFNELSWSPSYRSDIMYFNSFLGIDNFSSASRGPSTGGPLGATGLLFASPGMGFFPAPLGNSAADSLGSALGYQYFPKAGRQLVMEVAARTQTKGDSQTQWGLLLRFQQALTRRLFVEVDAFNAERQGTPSTWGARLELDLKL